MSANNFKLSETPAAKHYSNLADVPWDIQKYYKQRHSIFSRYDEGIWMTEDAWFGVTPEPIARDIAQHVADTAPAERNILIDCFAGVGGNTIAFAKSKRWKRIYAIEKDPIVLACAKHNAEIYECQHLISWYEGDCFTILKKELVDLGGYSVIFASPPWGGPGYRSDLIFDLSKMQPYSLADLLTALKDFTEDIALYLPRTSDLRQLGNSAGDDRQVRAIHYCMEGASKALCAYFGGFQPL